jgi:hypothetical protein
MENFDHKNPTRIIFGKDTHKAIGEYLAPYAKKVLLHYGSGSIKKSGLYDDVVASLNRSNILFIELGGVQPNPRVTLVREGIELCRKEHVDLILAVGGGSVIDSAKAIGFGVPYQGDVWDLFEDYFPIYETLPVATILTLPATGSEASNGSVITNEEKQLKRSHDREICRPLLSVINPELFYTLPQNQIANGIADIMSHLMEQYFTNTKNTVLVDRITEAALRTVMECGPKLIDDPTDYNAWSEVSLTGTLALTAWLAQGRVTDWATHMLEHELSAIYDVAHGNGLSILTPAWMKYVYKSNPGMFLQFAVNVMDVPLRHDTPEETILEAINRLSRFFKAVGLPVTLAEIGIDGSKFELMAKKTTGEYFGKQNRVGGVKALNTQDVIEIFKLAEK